MATHDDNEDFDDETADNMAQIEALQAAAADAEARAATTRSELTEAGGGPRKWRSSSPW